MPGIGRLRRNCLRSLDKLRSNIENLKLLSARKFSEKLKKLLRALDKILRKSILNTFASKEDFLRRF